MVALAAADIAAAVFMVGKAPMEDIVPTVGTALTPVGTAVVIEASTPES
jgi:hypothetical protein